MSLQLESTSASRVNSGRVDADSIDCATAQFPSRILIASDTYPGQMNGVELSLTETRAGLEADGHQVASIKTDSIHSTPLPRAQEVRVTFPRRDEIKKFIAEFKPDAIHIATEGPVGFQVRGCCMQLGYEFTTSFHTLWPKYAREHFLIPENLSWKLLAHFHGAAVRTMTRSSSMAALLQEHGFRNVVEWNGGVDLSRFRPGVQLREPLTDLLGRTVPISSKPVLLYVGRVSREKNLEAFLSLQTLPGIKIVIGDGSALPEMMQKYPETFFIGRRAPEDLPALFCSADVFVFPSKTDTFGRVIIEALACGTPVAAFPVTGPKDIINSPQLGKLSDDLTDAIHHAMLHSKSSECVRRAEQFSLRHVLQQFKSALTPARQSATPTIRLNSTLADSEFLQVYKKKINHL